MGKRERRTGRVNNNYRCRPGMFWKPGDELTESDRKMIEAVQSFYEQNGYTPARKEIANEATLKQRFRVWEDVLLAAGLPGRNDPENAKRRQEAIEWQKRLLSEDITE